MTDFTVTAADLQRFKETSRAEATQICAYWKVLRPILLLVKGFPFVPQPVKDAIDWIIKFGDSLCPGSLELASEAASLGYRADEQPTVGAVQIESLQTKTSRAELWVDHANGVCYDNKCIEDGGCARCGTVAVYLPAGSRVLSARYYTTAHYPDDYGTPQAVAAGQDVAWSVMEPIKVTPQGPYQVVSARYHNRSHNRARLVAIEVDWQ